MTAAKHPAGRCGDESPTNGEEWGQPLDWCALPAGHAGWHKSDRGTEWYRRPAGHDAHQQTAAELRRRIHETLGWPEQDALIAAALAAAEQRGRDDEKRKVRELAEVLRTKAGDFMGTVLSGSNAYLDAEYRLLDLADRSEAAT